MEHVPARGPVQRRFEPDRHHDPPPKDGMVDRRRRVPPPRARSDAVSAPGRGRESDRVEPFGDALADRIDRSVEEPEPKAADAGPDPSGPSRRSTAGRVDRVDPSVDLGRAPHPGRLDERRLSAAHTARRRGRGLKVSRHRRTESAANATIGTTCIKKSSSTHHQFGRSAASASVAAMGA